MKPTTHHGKELAKLPVTKLQDVLLARLVAREQAVRLGFAPHVTTQIATAVSEITRNVVQHARASGQVRIFEVSENGRLGLCITVEDTGVGISDVNAVIAKASPGAGLAGCRKLMDELAMTSTPGGGTAVTIAKWLPDIL